MPYSILITANVLQNGLLRDHRSCLFYIELLRRLAYESTRVDEPMQLYMSDLDWDLAVVLPRLYGISVAPACWDAYQVITQVIRVGHIDEEILEHAAGFRPINFCDSLRLACASNLNVDAIVTWEPYQFLSTDREERSLREHGYFDVILRSVWADDGSPAVQTIRIFSVEAFLSMRFGQDGTVPSAETRKSALFQMEGLRCRYNRDHYATVVIRTSSGDRIQQTATGLSPIDAIYRAIDECVDSRIQLPTRHLVYFNVPATIGGTDADAEARIRVECGGHLFQSSASDTSLLRAFADAYVAAINDIYHSQ